MSAHYMPSLPWTLEEDDLRFRRILRKVLFICLILALIIPWLPLPHVEREVVEELPPRLAKLLLEREAPPPPKPVEVPKPTEQLKPEAKPAPKKETPKPPTKDTSAARAKAERAGLLAFKDELAALRDEPSATKVAATGKLVKGASGPAKSADRSLITSNATGGSGGINTARLSRDTGGGGLAGRATTQVSSSIGSDGGAGVQRGGGKKAARSLEEIQLVFDRNKSAIYAIYNRALREDPSLKGKVVLKLTISSSGSVVGCQVVSSDLRAPDLERKLVARVKQFDFGRKDVNEMVVTYPIDFLPS